MTGVACKMVARKFGLASFVLASALMPIAVMAQETPVAAEQEPATDSGNSSNEGWDWVVAPYLWATSISTNLREDAPPVGSETEFSDIISKIDMAFQLHVEGQGDRFGVFGDVTYLSLSDSKERALYFSDASVDTSIVELAGVWNVEPQRYEGLDVFAGVRHVSTGADIQLDPVNPLQPTVNLELNQSFSDFMVGMRYNANLSDRWGISLRADGGWGDTDSDYNVSALLRYKVGRGSWVFGYRYMDLQVSKAGHHLDLAMSGPIFSFAFGF